jgi:hypothetical protein
VKQTLWLKNGTPNKRVLVELPHALVGAGMKQQCLKLLCSVEFMLAKIEGGLLLQLEEDFLYAMNTFDVRGKGASRRESASTTSLSFDVHYRFLIKMRGFVLKSSATFLQLALNTEADGVIRKQCIEFLRRARSQQPVLFEKYGRGLFFNWKNNNHQNAWLVDMAAAQIDESGGSLKYLEKRRTAADTLSVSLSGNGRFACTAHALENSHTGEASWWNAASGARRPLLGLRGTQVGSTFSTAGDLLATFSTDEVFLLSIESQEGENGQETTEISLSAVYPLTGRQVEGEQDSVIGGEIMPSLKGDAIMCTRTALGDVKVTNLKKVSRPPDKNRSKPNH